MVAPVPPETPSTSKRIYAWTRFWAPLGGNFASFDGFLTDPQEEWGARLNPGVRAWAQIAERPCLVLLGEPGMGKSTEVRRAAHAREAEGRAKYVDLALYESVDHLLREVFEDGAVDRWVGEGAPFELFFDALDESLFRVTTFAKNLVKRLHDLPRDRTRVRIACRTADWPKTLEAALRELYPGDAFGIWDLLPLRRRDCLEAARENGFDRPDDFLHEVVVRELQPLAIKPLTLEMLLRTSEGGALPESRRELFEKATLLLATEPNDLYPRQAQSLTPAQRLAIAQRIAAGTILCGKNLIARDSSRDEARALLFEQIAGGTERVEEATVSVDATALDETLRTGLFSGAGPALLGWYHQAIAEFLAARWLTAGVLDARQVDSLLFHPEDVDRVVPQLREVAAWVAVYEPRVLTRLAEDEPNLLLGTDALALDATGRARVVDVLLRKVEALEAHDLDHRMRLRYATLKHPGLADQLLPFITDRAKHPMVRRVAIDIAEACAVTGVEEQLVEIALDSTDAYGTRQQALTALGEIGSASARRQLRRLVTEDAPEDVRDELRGCALQALWPDHLTRAELFAALRAPRAPNYYGGYASFLASLVSRLSDADIADALDWATIRNAGSPLLRDEKNVEQITERALRLTHDPLVVGAYARFVAASLRNHLTEQPAAWGRLISEPNYTIVRRVLLLDILPSVNANGTIFGFRGLLGPDDFLWLVSQLNIVSSPRQVIIDAIAEIMLYGLSVDDLDAVLSAALRHVDLANRIAAFTRAIDIDSEFAASQRSEWQRMAELMVRPERPLLDPPPAVRVRRRLEAIERGDTAEFWSLDRELALRPDSTHYDGDWDTPITSSPGWVEADGATRLRILSAAKTYLVDCDAERDAWFGKGLIHYPAIAGYRALQLLLELDSTALDALVSETWAKWASIIVAVRSFLNDREPGWSTLLKRGYDKSPDALIEALTRTMADEDRRHKTLFTLSSVEGIWDARLALALTRMISASAAMHPESTAQILALLLRHETPDAVALARRLVVRARVESLAGRSRIRRPRTAGGRKWWRRAARTCSRASERLQRVLDAFLNEAPASAWPTVRQLMLSDRIFARRFFEEFAYRHDHHHRPPTNGLPENAVAACYLWLRREFPSSEDPVLRGGHVVGKREAVGHLRERILEDLKQRKTFAARDAIRQLARATGDRSLLLHAIDVETLALAEAWVPPAPGVLVRLLREREARVVTSGAQLLDVVLDSLRRLQERLQGEIAEVPNLWDGGGNGPLRPKDEEHLSDFVAAHLDRDLRDRGVVINREVQIRRQRGERSGDRTDIHVDAVTASRGSVDRLRLIVEAKGNWNRHLETDLEDQLVNRYLAENEARHGIYLVGWYASVNWDPTDSRKAAAERRDRAAVTLRLADKAKSLSVGGSRIEVFVLDTRM